MINQTTLQLGPKDLIRFALLCLLAAGALAGCSTFESVTEIKSPPPTPTPAPAPVRKVATHELGSLWSEDSLWNHMYTSAAARVTGDMITIKVDDALRKRINAFKLVDPKEIAKAKEAAEKAASEGKGNRAPAAVAPKEENLGPLVLKGNIEEVGQRGVYRIQVVDSLRLGDWEPYITLKGRVRDRDISITDEIEVASIADMTLEVTNGPPSAIPTEEERQKNVSW
jgi:flagellar basal body L-ring protein FlgH